MIDFLFLMLALFATLAISRAALYDSDINLAQIKTEPGQKPIGSRQEIHQINLTISALGLYQWLTEFHQYPMANTQAIQDELTRQYEIGVLGKDKAKTEVLLHIDKQAPWESISQLIFAIKEMGFNAHPVYEPL